MGDRWIPEGVLEMKPMIRNLFENTATVQVDFPWYLLRDWWFSSLIGFGWWTAWPSDLSGFDDSVDRGSVVGNEEGGDTSGHTILDRKHAWHGSCSGIFLSPSGMAWYDMIRMRDVNSFHYIWQVTLGITTLLSYVPVSLGSAHQAGALTLLSLFILLNHTLRRPSPALLKSLPQFAKPI